MTHTHDPIQKEKMALLWKQRFENLKGMVAEMISRVDVEKLEVTDEPIYVASDLLYISFSLQVVDTEAVAIKLFGEGNYDVYRLWKKSKKQEDEDAKERK